MSVSVKLEWVVLGMTLTYLIQGIIFALYYLSTLNTWLYLAELVVKGLGKINCDYN